MCILAKYVGFANGEQVATRLFNTEEGLDMLRESLDIQDAGEDGFYCSYGFVQTENCKSVEEVFDAFVDRYKHKPQDFIATMEASWEKDNNCLAILNQAEKTFKILTHCDHALDTECDTVVHA
jgi:hypothetical protein